MKRITIESHNTEIQIISKTEADSIMEVIEELIIPALKASGFHEDTINDGLSNYVDEHNPLEKEMCDQVDCNNERDMNICNECFDKLMYKPSDDPVQIEREETETLRCEGCGDSHVRLNVDNLCEDCAQAQEEYDNTCPSCGGDTENPADYCNECQEEEEAKYEEEMEEEGVIPTNMWNTGIIRGGWEVPPADDKSVEPEQADIPEPESTVPLPNPSDLMGTIYTEVEPQKLNLPEPVEEVIPEPVAVSVWNTTVLANERTTEINEARRIVQQKREEERKIKLAKKEKERIANLKPIEHSEEQYQRLLAEEKDVQEKFDNGEWKIGDWSGKKLNCSSVKTVYNVDCDGSCSICPVGNHDRKESMSKGVFYCKNCENFFTEAVPAGYCPECGVHRYSSDNNRKEFCSKHWDMNREENDYTAGADEN